jgi:hypothetical protein
MNRKVIKSILNKKLNDWVKSIKDEKVQKLVKQNTIVTGGAIANLLMNEEVKDFDLYFKDKATTFAVAQYYVNVFNERNRNHKNALGGLAKAYVLDGETLKPDGRGGYTFIDSSTELAKEFANQGSALSRMIAGCTPDRIKVIVRSDGVAAEDGKDRVLKASFDDAVEALSDADQMDENLLEGGCEALTKDAYRPVFLSTNAITLSDKVQLVTRFYGDAETIHKNYDFVHCTNYFDFGKNELVLKQEALECLMNKELKYQGSKYPLCSVIRTRKFIQRGFHCNAGQYLKMCFQLSQLDLTNVDILEDQLCGVDSCYFVHLIEALRSKQANDPNYKVEESYVASIIDRIF